MPELLHFKFDTHIGHNKRAHNQQVEKQEDSWRTPTIMPIVSMEKLST